MQAWQIVFYPASSSDWPFDENKLDVVSEVRWVMHIARPYQEQWQFVSTPIINFPAILCCVLLSKKVTGLSWSKILLSIFF